MTSQEVFKLRKEGKFAEALEMARKVYAANPADPWNVKALAWALHSVVKEVAEGAEKVALAAEFLALPLPEDDEYLANTRKVMERLSSPYQSELQGAKEASKEGRYNEAMSTLRALAKQYPGEEAIETAWAWELGGAIGRGLQEEQPNGEALWRLVEEYGRLKAVPKPSLVHTVMLQRVAGMAQKKLAPQFCAFAHWWGLAKCLREEDFLPQKREEKEYDSLVERVISGIANTIGDCEDEGIRGELAEFVNRHAGKYPDQAWFPYYRAICLLAAGRMEEARPVMVEVTRKKMSEFWAWEKLGRCFPEGGEERLRCFCRAYVSPASGEHYKLTIFGALADILQARGMKGEARYLLERVRDVRLQNNWRVGGGLEQKLTATEGIAAVNPKEFVEREAQRADEVLLADIPWTAAVVTGTHREIKVGNDDVKKFHFLALQGNKGEEPVSARVPASRAWDELGRLAEGEPIEVRVDVSGKYPKVLAFRVREDGFAWDVYPERFGLVDRVNAEKGELSVLLADGQFVWIPMKACRGGESAEVGRFVGYRAQRRRDRSFVVWARMAEGEYESKYWERFRGAYRPRTNSPGGHVDRIFIGERLAVGLHVNQMVEGLAVQKTGKTGSTWWEAILAVGR